ncbi:phosphotransferase family enzyme [Anseongella ginsenosidimutans]|uniref:Phosphotransferase family enzyme n=1 Tax=Anseongella ginsenosidimutans TaxID=496056 RepID=A0A4R3KSU9_9SPHI|nr:aminoglycoside phosphotransferase family protein [Anseongella ginsenosidimutans]QEC53408.1 aminoglycoside phosphotransferase family protein [Anseongella ginsenosidimutans]TCS88298.1 phosphotransferase family enzyme [Anseongella ginsenosidimutans]
MGLNQVLDGFGLEDASWECVEFGSGHINNTYRLTRKQTGENLLLQRINHFVFKEPEAIAGNMRIAADHLEATDPDYLFLNAVKTKEGKDLWYDEEGFPWRILPFIDNAYSMDEVGEAGQARSAARQFAILTRKLAGLDASLLKPTIPDFHNLELRYRQFREALETAGENRKKEASGEIGQCSNRAHLAEEYSRLIVHPGCKLRIMHHDTKINNVLFDVESGEAKCPIDLDTLMPGYIFSDLGDMVRTYVSPVSEEETDLSKVAVRDEFYEALYDGYLSEMAAELSDFEKQHLSFSGKMLLYMQALRFLTDYLQGDVYYKIHYPGQNLDRSRNQLKLLLELEKKEVSHIQLIERLLKKYRE